MQCIFLRTRAYLNDAKKIRKQRLAIYIIFVHRARRRQLTTQQAD